MKSAEISDAVIAEIQKGGHQCIRLNYPNGDMVGHTGVFCSAVMAVEAMDLGLGRLLGEVEKSGGIAVITSDHGNADQMYKLDKKGNPVKDENGRIQPLTSHTLNRVPFIIFDPAYEGEYTLRSTEEPGLTNIASTCLLLLGFQPPDDYRPALITLKDES